MDAPNVPNPANPNALANPDQNQDQGQDQDQVPPPVPAQPVPQLAPAGAVPVPQIIYQNWISKKPATGSCWCCTCSSNYISKLDR